LQTVDIYFFIPDFVPFSCCNELRFCMRKTVVSRQLGRYSDLLRAERSGDRIPIGGEIFRTRLGAHPASYAMGTRSFPGLKRPGRGVDDPSSSSTEVKESVELYFYSPPGISWPVIG
jgi:hypothetical protein